MINLGYLAELFEGVYQTGRWPIGVYPGWLRYSMTYLVPVGFAVTVPAQALTNRLHLGTVGIALGFALALDRVHALVLALRAEALFRRLRMNGGAGVATS